MFSSRRSDRFGGVGACYGAGNRPCMSNTNVTKMKEPRVVKMVEIMEKKSTGLAKQLDSARQENNRLSDTVVALNKKLKQKDGEIESLRRKNPPLGTVIKECCLCKQKDKKIEQLQCQLDEAIHKQHEAMSRALQLAERNQMLQKELEDLHQLATRLEEKYGKGYVHGVKSSDVIAETGQAKELEGRLKEVRERLDAESAFVDVLKKEKESLERDLATALTENKTLAEQATLSKTTEEMLKGELLRLKEANMTLHQRWKSKEPLLECREIYCGMSQICPCKCPSNLRLNDGKNKRLRDKIEPKVCGCAPSLLLLDKLQKERDFYHNECHNLREQIENIPLPTPCSHQLSADSSVHENSTRILLERFERERKIAEDELQRIKAERDSLRLKADNQSFQSNEISRLERNLRESEESIRKLESERRILLNKCDEAQSQIQTLEKRCDDYRLQLDQINAIYTQLKNAHEQQVDRNQRNGSYSSRLAMLESDLNFAQKKLKDAEVIKRELDDQIVALTKEKMALLNNLSTTEREKDQFVAALDEKTERLLALEKDNKRKESQLSQVVLENKETLRKLDLLMSEKTSREHTQRTLELSVQRLEEEVSSLRAENRRLQDDLACALRDGQASRIEADNLKKQLQHYVAEVKKTEELISKKEKEQSEMLQNFHALTLEASTLENSNHSLESEVGVTKAQLERLQMLVQDLERRLVDRNSLTDTLEKQVETLAVERNELEAQLEIQSSLRKRAEVDLEAMRDLCRCIDDQKETMRKRADSIDDEKMRDFRKLREQTDSLNGELIKEKSVVEGLRHSLTLSRQETIKHQLSNKELSTVLNQLKSRVDELEKESGDVRRYQEQCAELNQHVTELRKELTNIKFDCGRYNHEGNGEDHTSCENFGRNLPRISLPLSEHTSISSSTLWSPHERLLSCDICECVDGKMCGLCLLDYPYTCRVLLDKDFSDDCDYIE